MKKEIIVSIFALFLVMLFGCTFLPTDSKALIELTSIKEKYGVTDNFSTSSQTMSEYISEISKLQSKNNTTLIRFELYSSQAFYYLIKANASYDNMDYQIESCKSLFITNARNYSQLTIVAADKAINESNLSDQEKQYLRVGQIESLTGYKQIAQELIDTLTAKCGEIL